MILSLNCQRRHQQWCGKSALSAISFSLLSNNSKNFSEYGAFEFLVISQRFHDAVKTNINVIQQALLHLTRWIAFILIAYE